jgi:hypothetical protein
MIFIKPSCNMLQRYVLICQSWFFDKERSTFLAIGLIQTQAVFQGNNFALHSFDTH